MSACFVLAFVLFVCGVISDSGVEADGPVLVVIGDSWGAYGWHDLQKVLTAKGSNLTVKSYAIGGM